MNKFQIILLLSGVALVALIYQLPRVVVENDQLTDVKPHELKVSTADNELITSYRKMLNDLSEKKKSVSFADSLASVFLKYQLVDSAQKYAKLILKLDSSAEAAYKAGLIYYQAFQNSPNGEQAQGFAKEAKGIFEELLLGDPDNASLKNKLAMTYMVSDNPMQGVMILREVLEKDPENREAIFNLGLLAIRSGQYDRAEERFQQLLEINADDHEAIFYLGVIYAESEQPEKSIATFKKYIEYAEADPALKATASNYIKELENI